MLLLIAVSIPLLIWPEQSFVYLDALKVWIENYFGLVYIWLALGVLTFVGYLSFGAKGTLKLGNIKPRYSNYSWASMLFCAGVATGILYWGIIEWAYYYNLPPLGVEARSTEAIEWAATYGMFHWGILGWAFYALPAVAIAYFFYVRKIPRLRMSTACVEVLGERREGWLGKSMDVFFMIGLLGASGTSLGLGTPMVASGLAEILGMEESFFFQLIVICFCTLIFATSVSLGLDKGIKRLSNFNTTFAFIFLGFILLAGPTTFILKMTTNSVGLMLQNFIRMSTWTEALADTRFVEDWSIFYWAWWTAVGPFMGIFIARISEGRSIRQIIGGTILFGSLGSILFFGVLGNYSLHQELNGGVALTQYIADGQAPQGIIAIIQSLPFGEVVLILFCFMSVVFMATSFDSTSFILASNSSPDLGENQEPAQWHRLFWAIALVLLPIALMWVGGLDALKTIVLISALPLVAVYILMMISLLKALRKLKKD
ncbi:MAG: BCCT family transporter [Bacteroidota bacterium]